MRSPLGKLYYYNLFFSNNSLKQFKYPTFRLYQAPRVLKRAQRFGKATLLTLLFYTYSIRFKGNKTVNRIEEKLF